MRIALLSPGAMGAAIGARLVEGGATVLTSLVGRSAASAARAHQAGMVAADDGAVARCDLILSVVPPAEAEPLLRRMMPLLRDASTKPPFLDANALAPATKRSLAAQAEQAGVAFVDGCIIGGPPAPGTRGPSIHVAGPHAAAALPLRDLGLDVRLLDGPVGAAAALKMCFSGLNKGLVGLATAALRAAERAGAGAALHGEIAARLPDLARRFARQVPDMYPKAYRWVAEMEEIEGFLAADPVNDPDGAAIYGGLARLFARMAQDAAGDGAERALLDQALARA